MLYTSPSLLFLCAFLSTTTSAAPTRTHCRCTIVSNAPPPAIYSPSAAHWTPTDPSPSPVAEDFCANLGPELENFPHAARAFVNAHSAQASVVSGDNNEDQKTSTILVNFASRNRDSNIEPRPTQRPNERIVCQSEPEPFTAYQDSLFTLWMLQIIVAVAIFACLAEGVHLGIKHYQASRSSAQSQDKLAGFFRLPGSEKLLLAIPTSQVEQDLFSPGQEKKLHASPLLIVHSPSGRREFTAYGEDDDDEANRPVM